MGRELEYRRIERDGKSLLVPVPSIVHVSIPEEVTCAQAELTCIYETVGFQETRLAWRCSGEEAWRVVSASGEAGQLSFPLPRELAEIELRLEFRTRASGGSTESVERRVRVRYPPPEVHFGLPADQSLVRFAPAQVEVSVKWGRQVACQLGDERTYDVVPARSDGFTRQLELDTSRIGVHKILVDVHGLDDTVHHCTAEVNVLPRAVACTQRGIADGAIEYSITGGHSAALAIPVRGISIDLPDSGVIRHCFLVPTQAELTFHDDAGSQHLRKLTLDVAPHDWCSVPGFKQSLGWSSS